MRKTILFLVLLITFSGCQLTEKPEFVRIENIDVVRADLDSVKLKANAIFLNHNHLGGSLTTDKIEVLVDEKHIATVSSEEFKVPAKDEFSVPLTVNFSAMQLLEKENSGILGSILKQVLNRKVVVTFRGNLEYKVVGFSSTYPIDHTEEIEIK